MTRSSELEILSYAAGLRDDQPARYLVIGGLPRSGTSSCERWLHGFRHVFVADEFQGLNDASYRAGLRFKADYVASEVALWTDARGRTWRGTTRGDLERRRTLSETVALLLATRPAKFAGKEPADLRVFGFKLPLIEAHFHEIWPTFGDEPCPFVYCARNPTAMIGSLWTMPWVGDADPARFLEATLNHVARSLAGYDRIVASGAPTAIWRTPSSEDEKHDAVDRLGLASLAGARDVEVGAIDEWPRERRRRVDDLPAAILRAFEDSPVVGDYRERFDV